jgi:magnesium-transporting ATPase (P-type)
MSVTEAPTPLSAGQPSKRAQNVNSKGLTSAEAQARFRRDGPNSMPDASEHPLRNALTKFWAPVPWLLEASIVLEIVLHKYFEAGAVACLLIFNAALAYFQEDRAHLTLNALKSRLAMNASVRRDGIWKTVPAAELVCGDLVKLSLGGVVAADVHLTDGSVLLDHALRSDPYRHRRRKVRLQTQAIACPGEELNAKAVSRRGGEAEQHHRPASEQDRAFCAAR